MFKILICVAQLVESQIGYQTSMGDNSMPVSKSMIHCQATYFPRDSISNSSRSVVSY